MADNMLFDEIIQTAIDREITNKIEPMLLKSLDQLAVDPGWITQLEKKVRQQWSEKLVSRFQDSDLTDLVKQQIDQVLIKWGEEFNFSAALKDAVDTALRPLVASTVHAALDDLVLDEKWLSGVETVARDEVARRVVGKISNVDFDSILREQIDQGLDRWRQRLLENFDTVGISDHASQTQLVVQDEAVVVNTALVATELLVDKDATVSGTLKVKDLAVLGDINTDNRSWQKLADVVSQKVFHAVTDTWRETLIQQVLDHARTQGIDFKNVTLDGAIIIDRDRLADSIKISALEKLGPLRDLTVTGIASLSDTLQIQPRRVGINTDDPEMALSVWDEEVNILFGKHNRDGAYIGTGRKQALGLGVDRKIQLIIEEDGTVAVKKDLRIDRFRLGFVDSTPGFSGTRGDFLLNSDPRPDQPFAWVCLGGFRWQALKAAS